MGETMVRPVAETAEFGKDHGLIHEMIVTGRKVGAGREFYSALAHDEALFKKAVAFVARGGEDIVQEVVVSIPLTEAEKAAIAILGTSKVLTRAQARGETEFPLRYSEVTLRACAEENANGAADWRLVYLRGNSLRTERERVGTERKRQPCFDPDYTWWLGESENSWASVDFEPGYYLIDFAGRFGRTAWADQDVAIVKLGPQFVRAHEAMVTEAAMRVREATGEHLLRDFWHWGCSLASDGRRVCVGYFARRGWGVTYCRPSWGDRGDVLRVCVLRKFDVEV